MVKCISGENYRENKSYQFKKKKKNPVTTVPTAITIN